MEKHLLNAQDQTMIRREIATVCGKETDYAAPLTYRECVHGLGHGAMYITDSDLNQALALCNALSNQKDQEACYSGVFMENSSSSTNIDHPSKFIDPKKNEEMIGT